MLVTQLIFNRGPYPDLQLVTHNRWYWEILSKRKFFDEVDKIYRFDTLAVDRAVGLK